MSADPFVQALRDVADWFEAHPDAPRPAGSNTINVFVTDPEMIAATARQATGFRKEDFGGFLALTRDFGGNLRVDFNFERAQVCTRRVVGTEDVPEKVIPAYTREIVEWDCHSILGGKPEPEAAEVSE